MIIQKHVIDVGFVFIAQETNVEGYVHGIRLLRFYRRYIVAHLGEYCVSGLGHKGRIESMESNPILQFFLNGFSEFKLRASFVQCSSVGRSQNQLIRRYSEGAPYAIFRG